jgi:hypothetical protein
MAKKDAPTLSVESVTPGPRKGGGRGIDLPKEAVAEFAQVAKTGYAGDGVEYLTRAKAQGRIAQLKRALVHFGHFKDAKAIKSRVWETESGKYRIGVTKK